MEEKADSRATCELGGDAEPIRIGRWCFKMVSVPFFFATLLLAAATACGIAATLLFKPLFDKGLIAGDGSVLLPIIGAQILLLLVRGALAGGAFDLFARSGARLGQRLTTRIHDHLKRHALPYFLGKQQSDILQLVRNDVITLETSLGQLAGQALISAFQAVAVLCVIVLWRPELSLVCVAGLGLGAMLTSWGARLADRELGKEIDANARVAEQILRALGPRGLLLRVSAAGSWADERLAGELETYRRALVRRRVLPNWVLAGAEGVGSITYFLFYMVGGYVVAGGGASAGELVAMAALLTYLSASANQLAPTFVGLKEARVRLRRIESELSIPPETAEPESPAANVDLGGEFRFEGVTVRYGEHEALSGIDVTFPTGRATAVVGPSGAGKTTLTFLLMRLIEPDAGRVLMGETPLSRIRRDDLWPRIGYVPQEPILFSGSVAENIALGRDAPPERIEEACRKAGIHDLVAGEHGGYTADAGEAGYRFSAGERQRLAIARALLADPGVLVLDEPTAHLDAVTEQLVLATITRQREAGRTVVVVTHNPATLEAADNVVLLVGGRLAWRGAPQDFLAEPDFRRYLREAGYEAVE